MLANLALPTFAREPAVTDTPRRYISINQLETAGLTDTNTLLARDVYERLYGLIEEAIQKANEAIQADPGADRQRAHNAVLIDGDRGSGKSTVLVNLPNYLQQKAKETNTKSLLDSVHILKPVDPTLLEEHDDLFLHVIVAAVLSDPEVQKAHNSPLYRPMLRALEELAQGLESVDAQHEQRGMDKLRSFIGNRQLSSKVHDFFHSILNLLGKKLLVLPIDDVDTALDRAYENLEIVRRYLNTPLVLPIISGDLALYNEVIWREFHGKLVKPTPQHKGDQAFEWANTLATEYQRKILPLPNRLHMPSAADYLNDCTIGLRSSNNIHIMPLGVFYAWLEIFITGPVNGLENSKLNIPIPSIRAMTQLIRRCGQDGFLEKLPIALKEAPDAITAKRVWQIAPGVDSSWINEFHIEYQRSSLAKKRDYQSVYKAFSKRVSTQREHAGKSSAIEINDITQFTHRLQEHFSHEKEAGACYLILKALQHWYGSKKTGSVLDTPLFQPLHHTRAEFKGFEPTNTLEQWSSDLKETLPGLWLAKTGAQSVLLPYPTPEQGGRTRLKWDPSKRAKDSRSLLLLRLLTHQNYYTENARSTKINTGRLLELLITSLIRDISAHDIAELLYRAPFYSTSTLAPTKPQTLHPSAITDEEAEDEYAEEIDSGELPEGAITLSEEINTWRQNHRLKSNIFSPWLIYNALNKTINQSSFYNPPREYRATEKYEQEITHIGLLAFYSLWSAFGSFEKGPILGFPPIIATLNLSKPKNPDEIKDFKQHPLFKQNILPFYPQQGDEESDVSLYGKSVRSITYYLGNHPLHTWLRNKLFPTQQIHQITKDTEAAIGTPTIQATQTTSDSPQDDSNDTAEQEAKKLLRKILGLSRTGAPRIGTIEENLYKATEENITMFLQKYGNTQTGRNLKTALQRKQTQTHNPNA